jgi:hypothetical protein
MLVGLFAGRYAVPRRSGLHWHTFHTTFSENILTGSVKRDKCGLRVALVNILLSLGRKTCQRFVGGDSAWAPVRFVMSIVSLTSSLLAICLSFNCVWESLMFGVLEGLCAKLSSVNWYWHVCVSCVWVCVCVRVCVVCEWVWSFEIRISVALLTILSLFVVFRCHATNIGTVSLNIRYPPAVRYFPTFCSRNSAVSWYSWYSATLQNEALQQKLKSTIK